MKRILKFIGCLALGCVGLTTLAEDVATIDGKGGFETLAQAFTAAGDDDVIVIAEGTHDLKKADAINGLAGKKITLRGASRTGTIIEWGTGYKGNGLNFSGMDITIENMSLVINHNLNLGDQAAYSTQVEYLMNPKAQVYRNLDFTGAFVVGNNALIEGCSFNQNPDDGSDGNKYFLWVYGGMATVKDCVFGTVKNAYAKLYNSNGVKCGVQFSNCKFNGGWGSKNCIVLASNLVEDLAKNPESINVIYDVMFDNSSTYPAEKEGCKVVGPEGPGVSAINPEKDSSGKYIGGEFVSATSGDEKVQEIVSKSVPEGYKPAIDPNTGKISIVEQPVVAKIGNKGYESLASAIAEAVAGDTVTLKANITLEAAVQIGKKLTLDLATFKLTAAAGCNAIEVIAGGDLTIVADATNPGGIACDEGKCCIYADNQASNGKKTIVVNGGVYDGACQFNEWGSGHSGEKSTPLSVRINDGIFNGELTGYRCYYFDVYGGTFNKRCEIGTTTTCYAGYRGGKFAIEPGSNSPDDISNAESGKIRIIKAVYFKDGYYHVFNPDAPKEAEQTIVQDAVVKVGTTCYYVSLDDALAHANTNVNGDGELQDHRKLVLQKDVDVTGKEIRSEIKIDVNEKQITGTPVLPEGKDLVKNDDGTISVGVCVAQIGDKKYATVAAAFDAAVNDDTINIAAGTHDCVADAAFAKLGKKTVTLKGVGPETILDMGKGNKTGVQTTPGTNLTLEDMTLKFDHSNAGSPMYHHTFYHPASQTFRNVTIVGQICIMDYTVFDGCTFTGAVNDADEYLLWCYGCSAKVVNCKFTGTGTKAPIKLYNEGGQCGLDISDTSFAEFGEKNCGVYSSNKYPDNNVYEITVGENVTVPEEKQLIRSSDAGLTVINPTKDEDGKYTGGTFESEKKTNAEIVTLMEKYAGEGFMPAVDPETGKVIVKEDPIKGKGTADDPFRISNLEGLKSFRDRVNAGNTYAGKYVVLTGDITFEGEWDSGIGTEANPFRGTFDGQNYAIKNLKIVGGERVALFGHMLEATDEAYDCTIKNVTLENATISGTEKVAGIVGFVKRASVSNCKVIDSTITGTDKQVAGIIASVQSASMTSCSVVNSVITGKEGVGGAVGQVQYDATISDFTITGTKVSATSSCAGAICGWMCTNVGTTLKVADNTLTDVTNEIAGVASTSDQMSFKLFDFRAFDWGEDTASVNAQRISWSPFNAENDVNTYEMPYDPQAGKIYTIKNFHPVAEIAGKGIEYRYEKVWDAVLAAVALPSTKEEPVVVQLYPGVVQTGGITGDSITFAHVVIQGASDGTSTLKDCEIQFQADANMVEDLTFKDIVWDNSRITFSTNSKLKDIAFIGNTFKNLGPCASGEARGAVHMNLPGGTCMNLVYEDNVFDTSVGGSFAAINTKNVSGNITIRRNVFKNSAWRSLQLMFNSNDGIDDNVTLTDNWFVDNKYWIQINGQTAAGGDAVGINVNYNVFDENAANHASIQIASFNAAKTSLALDHNYYTLSPDAAPDAFDVGGDCTAGNIYNAGVYPYYNAYHKDELAAGTMTVRESLYDLVQPAAVLVKSDGTALVYKQLADAVAAAESGDRIKMLVASVEKVVLNAGVTLDPNGFSHGTVKAADGSFLKQNEDGSFTAQLIVAKIGDQNFASLADAVAAVQAGLETPTTIRMVANETMPGNYGVTIPTGKDIVLDLNGFRVCNDASESNYSATIKIESEAKLCIKDSVGTGVLINAVAEGTNGDWGTTPKKNWASDTILSYGTLVLDGGTIVNTTSGISYAVDSQRDATFIMNGGKLYSNYGDTAVRMFANAGSTLFKLGINRFEMHGGEIVSGGLWLQEGDNPTQWPDICRNNGAAIVMDGGTINGFFDVQNMGSVTVAVSGGVINADVKFRIRDSYLSDARYFTITGGKIGAAVVDDQVTGGKLPVLISGGLFDETTKTAFEKYVSEGSIFVANTDPATKADYPWTIGPQQLKPKTGEATADASEAAKAAISEDKRDQIPAAIDQVKDAVIAAATSGAVTHFGESGLRETVVNDDGTLNAHVLDALKNAVADEGKRTIIAQYAGGSNSTEWVEIELKQIDVGLEVVSEAVKGSANEVSYDVVPRVKTVIEVRNESGEVVASATSEEKVPNDALVGKPITFRLGVTWAAGDQVKVYHDDVYFGIATVKAGSDGNYVELKSDRFSTFRLVKSSVTTVCEVDGLAYESVAEAIAANADKPTAVIKLTAACGEQDLPLLWGQEIDVNGWTFTGSIVPTEEPGSGFAADQYEQVQTPAGRVFSAPQQVSVTTAGGTIKVRIPGKTAGELGEVRTSGRPLWQDLVMGSDVKLIPQVPRSAIGTNTVTIRSNLDDAAVAAAAKVRDGVRVKYQLMKKVGGSGTYAQFGEALDVPVFTVEADELETQTFWKILTIFDEEY